MGRDWSEEAKAILKAEMKRRRLTYADLAQRLAEDGSPTTENYLMKKISRGGFSAGFFLQCLAAIGARDIRLD